MRMKSGRSRGKDVVVQGNILEWTYLKKVELSTL